MHQATVRGFDICKAFFALLDACNRTPKAELLPGASYASCQVLYEMKTVCYNKAHPALLSQHIRG